MKTNRKDEVIYSFTLPDPPVYATPHDRHQAMLEEHRAAKQRRCDEHKSRKTTRKVIPILL